MPMKNFIFKRELLLYTVLVEHIYDTVSVQYDIFHTDFGSFTLPVICRDL